MTQSVFIEHQEFWEYFDRKQELPILEVRNLSRSYEDDVPKPSKKIKREGQYIDLKGADSIRYKICWGRHRPGKKTKIWDGDGFLTLIGSLAYISNEDGRNLEDPTLLDDSDLEAVKDMKELRIGNTEIMVDELLR